MDTSEERKSGARKIENGMESDVIGKKKRDFSGSNMRAARKGRNKVRRPRKVLLHVESIEEEMNDKTAASAKEDVSDARMAAER